MMLDVVLDNERPRCAMTWVLGAMATCFMALAFALALPQLAFAQGDSPTSSREAPDSPQGLAAQADVELPVSGEAGTCKWTIDEAGALVVEPASGGEGAMEFSGSLPDGVSTSDHRPPWYPYRAMIRSAEFKGRVSIVGAANGLFQECRKLERVDLSGLDTSKTTYLGQMFSQCESLVSIDASALDVHASSSFANMFSFCFKLSDLKLPDFSNARPESIDAMFEHCKSLKEIDLRTVDTSNVRMGSLIFFQCPSLEKVIVGDKWDLVSRVDVSKNTQTLFERIFTGCAKLAGANGTSFAQAGVTDYTYARIDAAGAPGYFWSADGVGTGSGQGSGGESQGGVENGGSTSSDDSSGTGGGSGAAGEGSSAGENSGTGGSSGDSNGGSGETGDSSGAGDNSGGTSGGSGGSGDNSGAGDNAGAGGGSEPGDANGGSGGSGEGAGDNAGSGASEEPGAKDSSGEAGNGSGQEAGDNAGDAAGDNAKDAAGDNPGGTGGGGQAGKADSNAGDTGDTAAKGDEGKTPSSTGASDTAKSAGASDTTKSTGIASGAKTTAKIKATAAKRISLAKSEVKLTPATFAYNGKARVPKVVVRLGGKTLKVGRDYVVKHSKGRTAVGTYAVQVIGKGSYTSKASKSFQIVPKAPKVKSVKAHKNSNGSSGFILAWHKVAKSGFGYEVRWSPAKSFKKAGSCTFAAASSYAAKGKAALRVRTRSWLGKTVYVQVRAFKSVGGKTYRSAWSASKSVKLKG